MEYLKALLQIFADNLNSILSFIGIVISYVLLKSTIKAINEQNRPFISLSIEPIKKPSNLFVVIRNTGNRTAENVEITSEPKLESFCSEKKQFPLIIDINGKINISGIAPNQEIISFFDHALYRYAKDISSNDKILLQLEYSYKNKKYKEKTVIDFSYIKSVAPIVNSPEDIDKNIKKIADSIISIDKSIKSK